MDIILTNSKNTQARIKKFLNLESHVLYPPVEQEKFKYLWNEDYFLSFARLADAKRVDKIVQAFQKLPQEQLIVIYGENDPQRYKIFELAQGYPNITLITLKDNNLLYEYIGKARATIYIPIDEDFWMSPVESMAAGKPVIWVDDGGLKETILDKMTWYMISKTAKIEDIEKAVQYMTSEKAMSMKDACQKRADDFGIESFETALKEIV